MTDEIHFGRYCLDLAQGGLLRDGKPVPLGNRALEILIVLASAKGEIVTKDELMARVWPGRVVEENNIQVHVSALRKALDDGSSTGSCVMTVPGRGYRLVGTPIASFGRSSRGWTCSRGWRNNRPLPSCRFRT